MPPNLGFFAIALLLEKSVRSPRLDLIAIRQAAAPPKLLAERETMVNIDRNQSNT